MRAMLSNEHIKAFARDHDEAEKARTQIAAKTQNHSNIDIEDAYRIQAGWIDLKRARNRKITGYKVGLTSRAMQQAMQIDEPDFGTLLNDMYFANGAKIETARFPDPRLEAELAFVLKKPLKGDNLSVEQVLDATDYIVPALELIAARTWRIDPHTGYVRNICDTIADNAANAGYILGECHISPDTDIRWAGCILHRNGIVEETGLAAGVLDHPANGLCWLAKRLAPHGVTLETGSICLAGSFTRPLKVRPGDEFLADYGSHGAINVSFI